MATYSRTPPIESIPIPVKTWESFIHTLLTRGIKYGKFQTLCRSSGNKIIHFPHHDYISEPYFNKAFGAHTEYVFYVLHYSYIQKSWALSGPYHFTHSAASTPTIWDSLEKFQGISKEEYTNVIRIQRTTQKGSKEAGLNLNIESNIAIKTFNAPLEMFNRFKERCAKAGVKPYRFYVLERVYVDGKIQARIAVNEPFRYLSAPFKLHGTNSVYVYYSFIREEVLGWNIRLQQLDRARISGTPTVWDCYYDYTGTTKATYLNAVRSYLTTQRGSKEAGMNLNIESTIGSVLPPDNLMQDFKNLVARHKLKYYRFYALIKNPDIKLVPIPTYDYVSDFYYDKESGNYKYIALYMGSVGTNRGWEWILETRPMKAIEPRDVWDCYRELSLITKKEYLDFIRPHLVTKQGSKEAGLNLNIESVAEMGPTAQGGRDGPFKSQIPIFPHIKPYTLRSKVVNGYIDAQRNAKRKVYQFYHLRHNSKGKIELETQKPLFISSIVHSQIPSITAMNQTVEINFYELLYWDYDHWQRCDLHAEIYKDIWKAYTRITGVSKQEYLNYVKILRATERGSEEAGLNLNIESSKVPQNATPIPEHTWKEFIQYVTEHKCKYYRFVAFHQVNGRVTHKPGIYDYITEPIQTSDKSSIQSFPYYFYALFLDTDGEWYVESYYLKGDNPTIWDCYKRLCHIDKQEYLKQLRVAQATQRGSVAAGLNLNIETISDTPPPNRIPIPQSLWGWFIGNLQHYNLKYIRLISNIKDTDGKLTVMQQGCYEYVSEPVLSNMSTEHKFFTLYCDTGGVWRTSTHYITRTASPDIWDCVRIFTTATKEEYLNFAKEVILPRNITSKGSREAGLNLNIENTSLSQLPSETPPIPQEIWDKFVRALTKYKLSYTQMLSLFKGFDNKVKVRGQFHDYFSKPKLIKRTADNDIYAYWILYFDTETNEWRTDSTTLYWTNDMPPTVWDCLTDLTGVQKADYDEYVAALNATQRGSEDAGLNLNIESASQNIEKPPVNLLNDFLTHIKTHNLKYYRFLSLIQAENNTTEMLKPYAYDYISEPYAEDSNIYFWVLCKFEDDAGLGSLWNWTVKRIILTRYFSQDVWGCLELLTGANKEMYKKLYHTFMTTQRGSKEAGLNLDVESAEPVINPAQVFLNNAHNRGHRFYRFHWPEMKHNGWVLVPNEYVYITEPYLRVHPGLKKPEYNADYYITIVNDGDFLTYTKSKPSVWDMLRAITHCDKDQYVNAMKVLRMTQKGSKQAGMNLDVESQSGFKKYLSDTSAKPESTI